MHEGKKLYRCSICEAYLTDLNIMKNHLVTVHEKEELLNCKSRELLQMNLFHVLEKPQICQQCGDKLNNKRELKQHVLSVHEEKKLHRCSICKASFINIQNMKMHIVSVHGKEWKPMELQEMNFVNEIEKSQSCDQCSKKFYSKNSLKGHILSVHKGKNMYRCSICKAYLVKSSKMKMHLIKIHGKENLLNCKPKQMQRMNLFHKIVSGYEKKENLPNSDHKSKRLYKCEFCNSKFGIQKFLEAHLKKVHKSNIMGKEDFVEYQLPYGWRKVGSRRPDNQTWDISVYGPNGERFRSNIEIRKYLERNPEVECDLDVTNTYRLKNMQKDQSKDLQKTNLAAVHKEKQPFGCDICKTYFSIKSDLMNHIESEHVEKESIQENEQNPQSKELPKTNLAIVDQKNKSYGCNICPSNFPTKPDLVDHNESVHSEKDSSGKNSEYQILDHQYDNKVTLPKNYNSSVHERKKAVKCPICKEIFSTIDQMKSHIGSVHFHLW